MWIFIGGVLAIWLFIGRPLLLRQAGAYARSLCGSHGLFARRERGVADLGLPVQDELWQGYVDNSVIVRGISAMPSMHNGSALLFALAGYQVSRFAGHLLSAHAILIFIGSIHLGWHYAVDSYLAWALTLVIWFAVWPGCALVAQHGGAGRF